MCFFLFSFSPPKDFPWNFHEETEIALSRGMRSSLSWQAPSCQNNFHQGNSFFLLLLFSDFQLQWGLKPVHFLIPLDYPTKMSATFQWVENLHITHHDTTQDFQFCIGITLKGLNFLEFPFCFFVCCCFTYLSWISSMSCRASWSLFTSLTYRDRSWGKQTDWVSLFRKHHHIYTLIMPLKGRFLSLIQFTLRRGSMHARFLAPFLQTLP